MVSKESLKKVVILAGPTASGKTSLAINLCLRANNVEIINADSIQVYKEFKIGSAQPHEQEKKNIPHHLMNILSPEESFTAADFVKKTLTLIEEIHTQEKRILIVGGTGFYLKALLYGMWKSDSESEGIEVNPEIKDFLNQQHNEFLHKKLQSVDPITAKKINQNDRYRLIRSLEVIESTGKPLSEIQNELNKDPNPMFELWVIDRDKEELNQRIEKRTQVMIQDGLIDEFQELSHKYPNAKALKSVGYAQVYQYLNKITPEGRKVPHTLGGLASEISLATRHLVKNQRTWFRGQKNAKWFILDQDIKKLTQEFDKIYYK